jgi:putative ABC transport system substrate-binding protein
MKRRTFIAGLGSAAAWPVVARAQQAALPVIGWLGSRNPKTDERILDWFHRGLTAQGYVEGRNVAVEYRWADGQSDRLPKLAADLLLRPVAVVVAVGEGAVITRAVQAINPAIRVVFDVGSDPVASGLVRNLNRPGGNITGVVGFLPQLGQKRLGLLHELLPRAKTIAILSTQLASGETRDMLEVAGALGLQPTTMKASNEAELEAAFAKLAQLPIEALLFTTSPFFFTRADRIVALAALRRIPAVHFRREFAAAGGLLSYGSNQTENSRVLGDYTGRVLNGEKPGDLPVVQPAKFELVINLKTAKALGLTIPETLLATADEVIQ